MRSPVIFNSETQFELCSESLRSNLGGLGATITNADDVRNMMARIAGYDTADEVILSLRASNRPTNPEDDAENADPDTFIYTLNEHQLMLQGRCESPGLLWKRGVDGFGDDLKNWQNDILTRQLGLNNTSVPVDIRCVENDDCTYFVATLNLSGIALEDKESAYRLMDHFVTRQTHPWPGLIVGLRMVDSLLLEAGMSEYPASGCVLLDLHNALANGQTIADVAKGNDLFMLEEFGEDMGPHNAKMIFGGNRLKHRQVDVQKRTGSTYASDKAGLAQAASKYVVEDTWRAMMQALSLTLTVYEQVGGQDLSAAEFTRLVRKNDAHLRRHMLRAFFLGYVPSMDIESVMADCKKTEADL